MTMTTARTLQRYASQPWTCRRHEGKWQIEAFIAAAARRETVAEVLPSLGRSATEVAAFIVAAVNDTERRERLIVELAGALEICLESEGLNWSAEHDAEIVLHRFKNRNAGK